MSPGDARLYRHSRLPVVATPGNQLLALEAKTGKVLWRLYRHSTLPVFASSASSWLPGVATTGKRLWRYKRASPGDMAPGHPASPRGGVQGGNVYCAAAADG